MPHLRRLTTIVVAAAIAWSWLALGKAAAQDYPSRVVRIVVAFPAGGPTDIVARLLADKLKASLGQNVIIENKPGANGAIGADYVAKGEPDGHLVFLTTAGAVVMTPHLSKPSYDLLRDFAPITLVVRPTTILVVKPDTPPIPPRNWPRSPRTSRERFRSPRPAPAACRTLRSSFFKPPPA